MDVQLIKDLVKVMDKGNLSKLHVKEKGGFEVSLERGHSVVEAPKAHFHHAPPQEFLPPVVEPKGAEKPAQELSGNFITSPMVGTFYTAPSPDDPAFVKVGDRIEKGAVVCIVEAMKLFNEIESEVSGKIVKVLADDTSPIEYDQPLFLVDPS